MLYNFLMIVGIFVLDLDLMLSRMRMRYQLTMRYNLRLYKYIQCVSFYSIFIDDDGANLEVSDS